MLTWKVESLPRRRKLTWKHAVRCTSLTRSWTPTEFCASVDALDEPKFPVILPRDSHVTRLTIQHFHARTSHQGKGMTLNEERANGFWVNSASSVVAKMILSCIRCQRMRGAEQEQRTWDLPEDRLKSTPSFTHCAVDYLGPLVIKEGRKEVIWHPYYMYGF